VYDLVICDVRMPDVDGKVVFRAVVRLGSPRPVVFFMTEYGDSPTYSDFVQARQTARQRRAARARPRLLQSLNPGPM
jgi:CheY-like chemotaxis protein